MEKKEIPFRHSKIKAKWITTDEIILNRKLKLKSNWPILRKGNWEPIAELTKFTYSENNAIKPNNPSGATKQSNTLKGF
jgi:hypothetical protein